MNLVPAPESSALDALRTVLVTAYPGGVHIADHLLDGPHWLLSAPVDMGPYANDLTRAILATWPGITVQLDPWRRTYRNSTSARRVTAVPHFAGQILTKPMLSDWDPEVDVIRQEQLTALTATDWACALVHAMSGYDGQYSPLVVDEDSSGGLTTRGGPLVRAITELGLVNVAALLTELGPERLCDRADDGTPLGYNDRVEQQLCELLNGILHTAAA